MQYVVVAVDVLKLNLSAWAKLVYVVLCMFSDKEGKSFPSLNMLRQITGIKSHNTIKKALKELEQAGIIKIEKRQDEKGTKLSNLYMITKGYPMSLHDIGSDSGISRLPQNQMLPNSPPMSPDDIGLCHQMTKGMSSDDIGSESKNMENPVISSLSGHPMSPDDKGVCHEMTYPMSRDDNKQYKNNINLKEEEEEKEEEEKQNTSITDVVIDQKLQELVEYYSQNVHLPTPREVEDLEYWLYEQNMDVAVIKLAIDEAVRSSARNMRYIDATLRNWHMRGLTTKEAVEAYLREWQDKKVKKFAKKEEEKEKKKVRGPYNISPARPPEEVEKWRKWLEENDIIKIVDV